MRNKSQQIELIKTLSDAFGPSGFEDEVSKIVINEINNLSDVHEDTLRNVTARLNNDPNQLNVMLDAHLDEVGFIVQAVKPNGTLSFLPLGGWVANTLPASKVTLLNHENQKVKGLIAAKPIHFMNENEKKAAVEIADMVIDVGAVSKQEVDNDYQIGIGTFAVPDVSCEYDEAKDLFCGKAFDCRIGVAALIETLHEIKDTDLKVNVSASFSTQEEVGERGIHANLKRLKPDLAIVFEGCPADDTFSSDYLIQSALRKGPMLRHFDRSMITSPRFQRFALNIARKHGIQVQESVRKGGGTNGGAIHLQDIPCIVIGIPVRYIHSHYGYATLADMQEAVLLASKIIQSLDTEIIKQF